MADRIQTLPAAAAAAAAAERRAAAGSPRSLQTVLTAAAVAGLSFLVATGDPLPMMVARAAISAAARAATSFGTAVKGALGAAAAVEVLARDWAAAVRVSACVSVAWSA